MSPARILVVCTANVCRSPMAAALVARHFGAVGVDAVVTSAGVDAFGLPVDPVAVEVMERFGIDIGAHRPRQVAAEMVDSDGGDLILTMTRDHLSRVVLAHPTAWPRTFTMRELARRTEGEPRAATFAGRVEAAGTDRRTIDVLRAGSSDDVPDPYGRGYEAVMRTAIELDGLAHRLAVALGAGG